MAARKTPDEPRDELNRSLQEDADDAEKLSALVEIVCDLAQAQSTGAAALETLIAAVEELLAASLSFQEALLGQEGRAPLREQPDGASAQLALREQARQLESHAEQLRQRASDLCGQASSLTGRTSELLVESEELVAPKLRSSGVERMTERADG